MKHFKKISLLALLAMVYSVNTFAQGFASFDVEGALFKSSIKNAKSGASKIEVIVGNDVDLKDVKFKYKLLSACRLEDKISKNFTSPQKVEVSKNADSKDWVIQLKKLQPADLPLELEFSNDNPSIYNSSTLGWVTLNTDESKPQVVRFGNSEVSFVAAFNGEPKDVSYDLKVVGQKGTEFDGKFEVSASADGKNWKTIATYDAKNPFSTDSNFTNELESDVRFVKWTYVTRQKQNVTMNNIIISPK